MASAHHNGTHRNSSNSDRERAAIRRQTPPDNGERCEQPVFNDPVRIRGGQNTELTSQIAKVLGSFTERKANFARSSFDSNTEFLGVHRVPSVPGRPPSPVKKSRPKERPPGRNSTSPPKSSDFTKSTLPSTSRPQASTISTTRDVNKSAAEVNMADTLKNVFNQIRFKGTKLSPIREPQIPSPRQPKPNKHPLKRQPYKENPPAIPAPGVEVRKMSPDCIDSTAGETQHWVHVNYARLAKLRQASWNWPENLERKIEQNRAKVEQSLNTTSSSSSTSTGTTVIGKKRPKKGEERKAKRKDKKQKIEKKNSRDTLTTTSSSSNIVHSNRVRSDIENQSDDSSVKSNYHPEPTYKQDKPTVPTDKPVRAVPDSSAVAPTFIPHKSYKKYIEEGERLKQRGNGMEEISPIQSQIFFMEGAYHFVMASHQLDSEFMRAKAEKDPERQDIIRTKIVQLTNDTLELCYRMRNFERKSAHENLLSRSERAILDRLIVICYKCEAHLNLLLYKCDNAKRDMQAHASRIQEIIKQSDKGANYYRGTPTSPIMSDEKPMLGEVQLEKAEWKDLKAYVSTATYLVKAHNKWGTALQKERETKQDHFFNKIQKISEMRELSLMSSLQDLSTYQKAVVDKLRQEIYETGDEHTCSA